MLEYAHLLAVVVGRLDLALMRIDALRRAGDYRRVAELLERLVTDAASRAERADLLIRLARTYADLGRHADAVHALRDARAIGDCAPGDARYASLAAADIALATAVGDVRSGHASWERLRRFAPLAEGANAAIRTALIDASMDLMDAYVGRGEMAAAANARAQLERDIAAAPAVSPAQRARYLRLCAQHHFSGVASLATARTEGIEAYRLAQESADARLVWEALYVLVDNHFNSLDLASVLDYGDMLREQAEVLGDPRLIMRSSLLIAATEAQQNRFPAALDRLEACRPLALGADRAVCALAEAHVLNRAGQPQRALARLAIAGEVTRSERLGFYSAIVELYRAKAFAALGDIDAAVAATHDSLELFQPDPHPYYLERAYAQLFRLTGRDEYRARTLDVATLIRAGTTEPRPALAPLAPRLDAPRAGRARSSALTPRQREIAHLVQRGLTNRVIAAQLGISQRTVAHHVEAILARLNLRARWQIPSPHDGG